MEKDGRAVDTVWNLDKSKLITEHFEIDGTHYVVTGWDAKTICEAIQKEKETSLENV